MLYRFQIGIGALLWRYVGEAGVVGAPGASLGGLTRLSCHTLNFGGG